MSAHVLDHLSAFLDSELEASEQQAVRLHLAVCPDCQRSLEELRALDELARGRPRELDPDKGPVELVTRVRAGLRPRRRVTVAPWWWAAAAALFLAVVPWALVRRNARVVYTESAPTRVLPPAQQAERAESPAPAPAERQPRLRAQVAADESASGEGQRRDVRGEAGGAREKDRAGGDLSAANDDKAETEKKAADDTFTRGFAPPPAAAAAPGKSARSAPAEGSSVFYDDDTEGRKARQEPQVHEAAPAVTASDSAAAKGYAGDLGGSAQTATAGKTDGAHPSSSFESADSARRARDRWTALAERERDSTRAEAARVAAIEAAAAAYRMERREDDWSRLRKLVRQYLARSETPSQTHVRQLLDEALAAKGP